MRHVIGIGVLTWNGSERRSDRYGTVGLLAAGGNSINSIGWLPLDVPAEALGHTVVLKAKVLETRLSTHVGDLFRGIRPSTPKVGADFLLGVGTLFMETGSGQYVGVIPEPKRESDWLNPEVLYQVHEQTVELYIEAE